MPYQLFFRDIHAPLVIFSRLAPMLFVIPGFGDTHITPRTRGLLTILICLAIANVIAVPDINVDSPLFLQTLFREVVVGIFLGLVARLWLTSMHVAGNIISMQISFSNASMFNPELGGQDNVISAALMVIAGCFIFITNTHHRFIEAFIESYTYFPLDQSFVSHDTTRWVIEIITRSFYLGVQLSLPFLILGTVFQVGLGFLNRLMPQMQIFFLAMPLQILGGLVLFLLLGSLILHTFMGSYEQLYLMDRRL